MDYITKILITYLFNIPSDIVRYIYKFVKYLDLTNDNIRQAVKLWNYRKKYCLFNHGHISFWDVSNITNMSSLFHRYGLFNDDISRWDVSSVKYMGHMFCKATFFNNDISSWDVSNVICMKNMFDNASYFNQNISGWNVSNVQNMSFMFYHALRFNQNISSWNISSVNNMYYMFHGASSFDIMDFFQCKILPSDRKSVV